MPDSRVVESGMAQSFLMLFYVVHEATALTDMPGVLRTLGSCFNCFDLRNWTKSIGGSFLLHCIVPVFNGGSSLFDHGGGSQHDKGVHTKNLISLDECSSHARRRELGAGYTLSVSAPVSRVL
jgi:hypothetical protein